MVIKTLEETQASIYISPSVLEEIDRVLDHPRILRVLERANKEKVEILKRVLSMSTLVRPKDKIDAISENLPDNMFLECAKEADVDYIITGDSHLKGLKNFQGIEIISPREFLDRHQEAYPLQ